MKLGYDVSINELVNQFTISLKQTLLYQRWFMFIILSELD